MSFFNVNTRCLGIDLGTDSILVSMNNKGIVVDIPTVIAVDKKTGSVLAIGKDAKEMLRKRTTVRLNL